MLYISRAVTSHLETSCYTIVVGKSAEMINKVNNTIIYNAGVMF